MSNCGTVAGGSAAQIPNYVILQNAQQFLKAATIPDTSNTAKPLRWSASFDSFQTDGRGIVRKANRTAGTVPSTGTGLTGLNPISVSTEQHPSSSYLFILNSQATKISVSKIFSIKISYAFLVSPIHTTGLKGVTLKVDSWAWT